MNSKQWRILRCSLARAVHQNQDYEAYVVLGWFDVSWGMVGQISLVWVGLGQVELGCVRLRNVSLHWVGFGWVGLCYDGLGWFGLNSVRLVWDRFVQDRLVQVSQGLLVQVELGQVEKFQVALVWVGLGWVMFFLLSRSGPRAYAQDTLQPGGLLCPPHILFKLFPPFATRCLSASYTTRELQAAKSATICGRET